MPTIVVETMIQAPIGRVFDLARSIDLHQASTSKTRERAVAGVTSGLIDLGEEVTWRARHFGVWQQLTVRISEFERTRRFSDVMVQGAFKTMEHHHDFESVEDGTLMRDTFSFQSPLGVFGWVVDRAILTRYMRRFLIERNQTLKEVAEGQDWSQYLDPPSEWPL